MKALWIRVEAHEVDSVKIAQLADTLGIDTVHALGHYVALGGAIAEHTDDGHIANIPNATIETWARWKGKRGEFARAVREILQDGDGNYDEWHDSMGKLVERRAKDRNRKDAEKRRREELQHQLNLTGTNSAETPPNCHGKSEEIPPTVHGDSSVTVRDVTGRTKDDDDSRARSESINAIATQLTVAANAAIARRWGEQPVPIRASAGRSLEAAEKLYNAKVPIDFAVPVIEQLCERARNVPKNLTFFVGQIVTDFTTPKPKAKEPKAPSPEAQRYGGMFK